MLSVLSLGRSFGGGLFNALFGARIQYNTLHIYPRQMNLIRVEHARFYDFLNFGNRDFACHRTVWIKVTRGFIKY